MQRKGNRIPSGHLSRLKPVEIDPLDEYGLRSKGEKRLLAPGKQEAFYTLITSRYLAFCTEAGDKDSLLRKFAELSLTKDKVTQTTKLSPPSSSITSRPAQSAKQRSQFQFQLQPFSLVTATSNHDLSRILSALRKLREALLASGRVDDFASQVLLFAARVGIQASHPETYYPSLLSLLRHRRHHQPSGPSTSSSATLPLTTLELHEATSYLILDYACRLLRLSDARALLINHYAHLRLLAPSPFDPPPPRDIKLDLILSALVSDNWAAFRRLHALVDGHRARLMDFALTHLRTHTLKALGRSCLSLSRVYLEHVTGLDWETLVEEYNVGWQLSEDGAVVVLRKVNGRDRK